MTRLSVLALLLAGAHHVGEIQAELGVEQSLLSGRALPASRRRIGKRTGVFS